MSTQPTEAVDVALAGLRPELEDPLLRVQALRKTFVLGRSLKKAREGAGTSEGAVTALDGLTFDVKRGETFGLVGESGCGKSTAARCILRLIEPSSGAVTLDGIDVGGLSREELRKLRRRMQIVFQDSTASLDARMSIRSIVEEPLTIHKIGESATRSEQAEEMLELVGISRQQARRKPHALSGGQRQRVGVARALVSSPDLVVLDEPVSAVDVSVQAQILNLLSRLQEQLNLTYLFIVHDLAVAEYFCDRLAVLYLGRGVEVANRETLFRQPLHPYTVSLLSAVPIPDPAVEARRARIILPGEASALDPSHNGCPFQPRCPVGHDRQVCREVNPPLEEKAPDHWTACHFPGELQVFDRRKTAAVVNGGAPAQNGQAAI
jgi:oligopeptide/dipeptide ABC transporter ATP-binding protein